MTKRVTIAPITRLEGHGKIEILLDEEGDVERAFFQVVELRGFEKFCEGRPAEEMPRITPRICGVCPTAHHMASTKALDDLYGVSPTPAAKAVRELMYCAFMVEDHALHFYFLGAPDFVLGPDAPAEKRNILGVIEAVGVDVGKKVIGMRAELRDILTLIGGKVVHPVCGLPGGVSKGLTEEDRASIRETAGRSMEFAEFTLQVFEDVVLKNEKYVDLVTSDTYRHETYYMGTVDERNKVNFYEGQLRVVDPAGREFARFDASEYLAHVRERVEPWSYVKFPYLRQVGWKGFVDGAGSGVYRVGPLGRLNASEGMATPKAHEQYERMCETLGGAPVHNTLAFHWARLIELLYAAERMAELSERPELTGTDLRNMDLQAPKEGIGHVEAPRGTLLHHYETDSTGLLTGVNLIVATLNNSAGICMSIEKAARALIKKGKVEDGVLNMVEMAFRAYDPCLACATHSLMGGMDLHVAVVDHGGNVVRLLGKE